MKTDELIEGELTDRILGAAMAVSNALGTGFLESVYHKALIIALRDNGLKASPNVSMEVRYKDQPVGQFVADIVVEGRIILELKAVSGLNNEHQAQLMNYLLASDLKVGLLLNFGNPRLQWKRLVR
jgi:GxxExxY protein